MKQEIEQMTDDAVEQAAKDVVVDRRKLTAKLIELLIEVERRQLHLKQAFSSMFAYCLDSLAMSRSSAYKHLWVARKSRDYPKLLAAVASGALHLTGATELAKYLTEENHDRLIAAASGKSRRQIRQLLARWFPEAPPQSGLRKLPQPRRHSSLEPSTGNPPEHEENPAEHEETDPVLDDEPAHDPADQSMEKYKLTVTIDREVKEALEHLVALERHTVPSGDLSEIVSEAIIRRLTEVVKRRFGAPRNPEEPPPIVRNGSRYVPAAIRQEVYRRDDGRCTYTCADSGRRCGSRDAIELHHLDPWAVHRVHDADRITLRCRAHNQYAARQDYGAEHVEQAIAKARASRSPTHSDSAGTASHPEEERTSTAQKKSRSNKQKKARSSEQKPKSGRPSPGKDGRPSEERPSTASGASRKKSRPSRETRSRRSSSPSPAETPVIPEGRQSGNGEPSPGKGRPDRKEQPDRQTGPPAPDG